nr:RICIN domain-containing protein [Natrinema sp. DC36]
MADASTADGANVQQWSANGHPTQRWILSSV